MRREIQGLRAVAVLLVVAFHLWPDVVPGGYVGVDVFFVISGYLITAHLLREVEETGRVRLGRFWARRLRRLLPAAHLVLLVTAAGVLVLVPRLLWQQFLGEVLASGLYVENWLLAHNAVDYLAAENQPSPAQHYWTLAAEEQFYLVWPVLVLLGIGLAALGRVLRPRRHRRARRPGVPRSVAVVLALVTLASLAYSLWITVQNPAAAYFVTPARAWEFGAGALVALVPTATRRPAARALLGWVALAALGAAAIVYDAGTAMPGIAAVGVVVATGVLLWFGDVDRRWSHTRVLGWSPAVWVGDVSYSVYLWHWPLIVLLPYATGHPLVPADKVSILLASLGLAAVTKRLVEDPVRLRRPLGLGRSRTTFAYALVAAAVLAAVCVPPRVAVAQDNAAGALAAHRLSEDRTSCFGAAARDPQATDCPNPALADLVVPAPEAAKDDIPPYAACYRQLYRSPLVPCHFGTRRAGVPHVAVIGDSHARIMMTMLQPLVDRGTISVDLLVMGGCPWSTMPSGTRQQAGRDCNRFQQELRVLLARTVTDYDLVLTTARLGTLDRDHAAVVTGLSEAWSQATAAGVPVGVLRDNPETTDPADDANLCLAVTAAAQANQRCALDRAQRLDGWYDALSAAAARTPGATLVDLTHFYCDATTCPVVIGGVNVYSDTNHLTVTYATSLSPYLYGALQAQGLLPR